MPNVILDEQILTDIADAIRAMNGSTTTYKPSEMAQAILDIVIDSGGGGGDIEPEPDPGGDTPFEPEIPEPEEPGYELEE